MSNASQELELSVVVALISGRKDDLDRCLAALAEQDDAPVMEVLVPYDRAVEQVRELADRYPRVRFILAEGLDTERARQGGSREHHDILRSIGIREARGPVVGLTEDHAKVCSNWGRRMLEVLAQRPEAGAVGGAVECGIDRSLNWALYFCDFGRYQNPLPETSTTYLSDVNVVYPRAALERVRDVWQSEYHEPVVHDALVRNGFPLYFTRSTQAWQMREGVTFGQAAHERFVWGRSYAGNRVPHLSLVKRAIYAILSPVLPFLLTLRCGRNAWERKRLWGRFLKSLPLIFTFHAIWAFGEFWGYVTGRTGDV